MVVFQNYDTQDYEDIAKQYFEDDGVTPVDEQIWDLAYEISRDDFSEVYDCLCEAFDNPYGYILQGTVGRWDGTYSGGFIFDSFAEMWTRATKDCDLFEIDIDDSGRFTITCSHHDGTNDYEIHALTEAGRDMIDDWTYDWDDPRTEHQVHNKLMADPELSFVPVTKETKINY